MIVFAQVKYSFYVLCACLVISDVNWDQYRFFYQRSGLPSLKSLIANKDLAYHFKSKWPSTKVYIADAASSNGYLQELKLQKQ